MPESNRKQASTDLAIRSNTLIQSIYVTTSSISRSPYIEIGKDVSWYVSGSKNITSVDTANRRVAVFGGDVIISGSLRVENCELSGSFNFDCDTLELTGSIDVMGTARFTENVATPNLITLLGNQFLTAGTGLSSSIAADGQITMSLSSSFTSTIEWNERLSGTTDGSNVLFVLTYQPINSTSLMIFMNGILQEPGANADFTIVNTNVTFNVAPLIDSKISATYSR